MKKILINNIIIIIILLVIISCDSVAMMETELTKEQKIFMVQRVIQSIGSVENYNCLSPKNLYSLFLSLDNNDSYIENLVLGFKQNVYNNYSMTFLRKLMVFEECMLGMDSDFYVRINPLIVERALSLLETKIDIINFCQALKTDYYVHN